MLFIHFPDLVSENLSTYGTTIMFFERFFNFFGESNFVIIELLPALESFGASPIDLYEQPVSLVAFLRNDFSL